MKTWRVFSSWVCLSKLVSAFICAIKPECLARQTGLFFLLYPLESKKKETVVKVRKRVYAFSCAKTHLSHIWHGGKQVF
jgi:hypothetical protein